MPVAAFFRLVLGLGAVLSLAACSGPAAPVVAAPTARGLAGDFVLALSWEPAFCETEPGVPECRSQTTGSRDARQFSLHGLWPPQTYCGVAAGVRAADQRHDWQGLPAVDLAEALRADLIQAMPGARSLLDRHEWIKHGTCAGSDASRYYAAALALTEAVNASALPELFVDSLGNTLSAATITRAADAAFGAGTGKRLSLECVSDGSRRLISGVRIALNGEIGERPDLGALAAAAEPLRTGCLGGVIDPAGLQ